MTSYGFHSLGYDDCELNRSGEFLEYSTVRERFQNIPFSRIPTEEELQEYYRRTIVTQRLKLFPEHPEIAYPETWISWYDLFGILLPLKTGQ
jgi:hypothetical protein